MYEEFYGLNRRPFENTPNPEFFFASKQHREALAALIYGIKQSKGFMLVTGEVGSGKTFLIQSLKYELEEENHIILEVATPWITPEELFAELPQKLGMDMDPEWGSLVFQAKLKEQLELLHEQERRVLVILDEAQQLPERTLEGIRLLSNFENEDAKLIQIIFLGQNELNDTLGRYSMRQIRQRITLSRSLGYFNEIETRRYIEHRLSVSGCSVSVFNDDALSLIFRKSHGSPRLINLICDNCLITGYAHFARSIDVHVVREVLADLPSVHHEGAYDYDQAPPSEEGEPLRVVAEPKPPLQAPASETAVSRKPVPTPIYETETAIEPDIVRNKPSISAKHSEFAVPEPLSEYDEDEIRLKERKSSGVFRGYGLWLVLIVTVVASWYAARWYESRQNEPLVDAEPSTKVPSAIITPSEPISPETAQKVELTWDDDPVMSGEDVAVVAGEATKNESFPVQTSEPPSQQPLTSAEPVKTIDTESGSGRHVVEPQYTSALERYSAGTKSDDGLSLFERLRREANVANVRTQPVESKPVAEPVEPKSTRTAVEPQKAVPVINLAKVQKTIVPPSVDGRAQVGVLEGVVVSSYRAKRYESGETIPYPFGTQVPALKARVRFTEGATVSQLARAKYTTWNDTVQDMVRALNPKLKSLDRVYTNSINLPDVSRADLLVKDAGRGWFVYAGTLTSRLKANNLYESFVALGEPADIDVTKNDERRIYRVYMGPYDNREQALTQLNAIDLTHMPYIR